MLFVATAFAAIPLFGYIHYRIGGNLEFHPFYLLSIIAAAWYGSTRLGITAALLSAAIWSVEDWLLSGFAPAGAQIFNEVVRLLVFLVVVLLVARWKAALARERALAHTDLLTGLANRRDFLDICSVELSRARRHRHSIAALFFDLDGFKAVNDTLGHAAGDALLRTVAETLRNRCRAGDICARLGGDEFAILLPETGEEAGSHFAEMLRRRLLDAMQKQGWPVTFSIGVAVFRNPPEDIEQLVSQADALMYSVKHGGKDSIRVEVR